MGAYLKLYGPTKSTNEALIKAIVYIGKNFGQYSNKKGLENAKYLKGGIKYIAKKHGRFRITAIKSMIYAKKKKGSDNKCWRFNKQTYAKAYAFIIDKLINCKKRDRNEVLTLLNNLYEETKRVDSNAERMCRNALIYWQVTLLNINSISSETNVAIDSRRIYDHIIASDKKIPKR